MEFNILEQVFDTLPERNIGYKPRFEYGSQEDCLLFLKQERLKGVSYYPLVWLDDDIEWEVDKHMKQSKATITLILANLGDKNSQNRVRYSQNIVPYLLPLKDDVLQALKTSGITMIGNDYSEKIFFKYSNDGLENEMSDIWDAIRIRIDVTLKHNCSIKKIIYYGY